MKTTNILNNNISGKAGKYNITIKDDNFKDTSIITIQNSLDRIKKIGGASKITIIINSSRFNDDATMLSFESLLIHIINFMKIKVSLQFKKLNTTILQYTLLSYSLMFRCIKNKIFDNEKFVKEYTLANFIGLMHMRKYIPNNVKYENKNFQSIVAQDIFLFVRNLGFDQEYSKNIGLVVSEMIDNVLSHTDSDAILTLKIADVIDKNGIPKKVISVALMNLSETLIYSNIKEKLKSNEIKEESKNIILKAYDNIRFKLNPNYDLDAFYFISAFQNNVTTRDKSSGGTGLPFLVKNLIEMSYDDFCYVISGQHCLVFLREFLILNDDKTIGFNRSNSYYNDIPDPLTFRKLDYQFNGTLYNLMFVY